MEFKIPNKQLDPFVRQWASHDGAEHILTLPGVMDIVRKHYYDDALESWCKNQGWKIEEDGEYDEGGKWRETVHFSQGEFKVVIRDQEEKDTDGKWKIHYRLYDSSWSDDPIFEGDDLLVPDFHAPLSLHTIEGLVGFLSLKEGDTDNEYFSSYTPIQLEWRDERAEALQFLQIELEEILEE